VTEILQTIVLPEDFLGQLSSSGSKSLFNFRYPFIVEKVSDTSHNKGVDLRLNDQILMINGQSAEYLDELEPLLQQYKGQNVTVTALRGRRYY
jgi:regulator of sigma E protease